MNIDEFLNRDPLFQQKPEEEKTALRDYFKQKPEEFKAMYERHPDIVRMEPEQRKRADEFYFPPEPEQTSLEKIGQTIKVTAEATEAGLARSMGGGLRAVGDLLGDEELSSIGTEMAAQNAKEQAEALGQIPKENIYQKFIVDVGSSFAQNLPGLGLSAVTGGAAPALIFAGSMAGSQRYDEARNAGYDPTESIGMGVIAGATEAAFEKLPLDNFFKAGRSASKKILYGALTEFAEETGTEAANMVTDRLIDDVYRNRQALLSDPEVKTAGDAIKKVLYSGLVGFGSGTLVGSAGAVRDQLVKANLNAKGFAPVYVDKLDAETAAPIDLAPEIQRIIDERQDEIETGEDVDRIVEEHIRSTTGDFASAQYEKDLEKEIAAKPLQDAVKEVPVSEETVQDTTLQASLGPQPTYVPKVDDIISLPLEPGSNLIQVGGPTINLPVDVRIVNAYPNRTADVEVVGSGEMIEGVDFKQFQPNLSAMTSTVYSQANKPEMESPSLIRFVQNALSTGVTKIEHMSPQERKLALGGKVQVWKDLKDAFGDFSRTSGTVRLVWDLMTYGAETAHRVLSHEIGHMIHLLDRTTLQRLGLGDFIPFKSFLETLTPGVKTGVTKADMAKQFRALPKQLQKDFTDLSLQWRTLPGQYAKPAEEIMADALSVLLSRPKGIVIGQAAQDAWDGWLKMNPKAAQILQEIHKSPEIDYAAKMRQADLAKAYAEKLKHLGTLSLTEELTRQYMSTRANFFRRLGNSKVPQETIYRIQDGIEQAHFSGTNNEIYMAKCLSDYFGRQIAEADITMDQMNTYALMRRVDNARKRIVKLLKLKPGENVTSEEQMYRVIEEEVRNVVSGMSNMSGLTPAEIEQAIQMMTKQMLAERTIVREIQLLSPFGLTPETAKDQMSKLMHDMGTDRYDKMVEIYDKWQNLRQEYIIENLANTGMIKPHLLEHMRQNKDYVTFTVVHHAFKRFSLQAKKGSAVDRAIHEQIGTTAAVGSVIPETIDNDVRLVEIATWQAMRRNTLIETARVAPTLAREVTKTHGKWPETLEQNERFITIWDIVNGKPQQRGFIIDETLEDALKPVDRGIKVPGTDYLTRWMTSLNIGFGIINPIRDVFRSARNLPGWAALWKLPTSFIANLPGALKSSFTENPNSQFAEAAREGLLTPNKQFADWGNTTEDKLLQSLGHSARGQAQVDGALAQLWFQLNRVASGFTWGMGAFVRGTEAASKIAAWEYVKKLQGYSPAEKRIMVRNLAGTPNLLERPRPSWATTLLLFYNPFVQGLRGDFTAFAKNPKQWIAKSMAMQAPFRMFALACLSGYMDKWLEDLLGPRDPEQPSWQEFFQSIPRYLLLNYLIVPVATLSDGTPYIMTIPMDPASQTIGAWAMAGSMALVDKDFPWAKAIPQMFETGAGMIPQPHPIIGAMFDTASLIHRGNIYDAFRGRDVVDADIAKGGTLLQRAEPVMKYYLFNRGLGGPLNTIMRLPYSSKQVITDEGRTKAQDYLAAATGARFFGSATIGRFLRAPGNAGIEERFRMVGEQREAESAQARLVKRELIEAIAADPKRQIRSVLGEVLTPNGQLTEEMGILIQKHPETFMKALREMATIQNAQQIDIRLRTDYLRIMRARSREDRAVAISMYLKKYENLNGGTE